MSSLAVWLLLLQIAKTAPMPELPSTPGVYYRQGDATWVRLQVAPIAEMKTRGMDLFIETGGFTNLGMRIVCRGAKASLRISVSKPTFFVRETASSKDLMLVRFTQKKGTRTFQTSSASATVENKEGFRKGDIRKMAVTEFPDHSFLAIPEGDLNPGEYLLVCGDATAGFDFGIDPNK